MNNLQQLDEALDYLNEGIKDVIKGAPYGKNEFKRLVSNLLKKNKGNKDKNTSKIVFGIFFDKIIDTNRGKNRSN